MIVADPAIERSIAKFIESTGTPIDMSLLVYGKSTYPKGGKDRVKMHFSENKTWSGRYYWTRQRMALKLGFQMLRIMPVYDLRKMHDLVRKKGTKHYYDLMPPIPLRDLCAINLYLEERVGIEPCPFPLLRKRAVWENDEWRQLAKHSVLYPWIIS